jgi:hypothetical protein
VKLKNVAILTSLALTWAISDPAFGQTKPLFSPGLGVTEGTANALGAVHPSIGKPLDQAQFPPTVLGNICYTPAGAFPGPFNPIGMACTARTPAGIVAGVVGQ